jgi:hypothetical protein
VTSAAITRAENPDRSARSGREVRRECARLAPRDAIRVELSVALNTVGKFSKSASVVRQISRQCEP